MELAENELDAVVGFAAGLELLYLMLEAQRAEELVCLLEDPGLAGLEDALRGREPQALDRRCDAGTGTEGRVARQVDHRQQPAVLDVEGPLPLARVLHDDVVHEASRGFGGQGKAQHPPFKSLP